MSLRRNQEKPKQFNKYLRNSENKLDLVKFLIKDWSTNTIHLNTLKDQEVFITCEDKAYRVSCNGEILSIAAVPQLESFHEEADTKLFLCAAFASTLGFSAVNIITVDSDVAILALYYQSRLDISLYLEMGTGSKTKIYDISSNSIDYRLQQALPSLHALSGCDSTSCFSGIGTAKCLKVLQTNQRFLDEACLLGEEENPSETVTEVLEEYVCHLYGNKKETSINTTR